jgi:hypothetical protein
MKLKDYIKQDRSTGWTPLHEVADKGDLPRVMKELQASGERLTLAHFLIPEHDGWTPLHWAANQGHLDQVMEALQISREKLTLEHFLIQDKHGWTPLHGAAGGHLDQVMEALRISGEKLTRAHFLIKNGTAVTPLCMAGEYGHLNQVFTPSHWQGRVGEMIDFWREVPEAYKRGFDFNKLRDDAILLSLPPGRRIDPGAFEEAARAAGSPVQATIGLVKEAAVTH